MKHFFSLLIALASAFGVVHAQSFKGHVIDSDNNDISFANVVLLKNGSFVNGVITDENGDFFFDKPAVVPDSIRISMMGYEDFISRVPASGDLGTVILKESATMLDELVVKSDLPATRVSGDGMITSIANTVMANVGTANDVLSKIPLVTGSEGKFTVFGRGEAVIYINGKVVQNSAELNQLSSADIKSVEVISNPGSKYSAETNAVIKIRTIRPKGEGFSASIYNSTRIAAYAVSTDNILLKYRTGNLEIFANGYFYGGRRKFKNDSGMTTFGAQTLDQKFIANTIVSTAMGLGKLGFDYQLGDNHSLGAYYQGGATRSKPRGPIFSDVSIDGRLVESFSQYHNDVELTRPSHEANVYYNGLVGNVAIDFNADFMQTTTNKDQNQLELNPFGDDNYILLDGFNKSRLLAEKLVVSFPVWKGALEVGEEFTNSSVRYINNYTGAAIADGDTKVKENNLAGFAQLSQTFGRFNVGVGLRLEYGDYNYYEAEKRNDDLSHTFLDLYPSLSLSTGIGNVGLAFNFTSRSRRPSYSQLDGSVLYVNRYTYMAGDPSLLPVKIYTAQLMAQWKFMFAQAVYSYEKNSIFSTTRNYNGDPLIKLVCFENVPHYQNFQLAIGAQPKFGCWSPSATFGVFCNFYRAQYRGLEKKFNSPYVFLNWDNAISLPCNWTIDVDMMAMSSGYQQNNFVKAMGYLNIGVRKSFFNNSFTVSLTANDILNTNNPRRLTYSGDILLRAKDYQESRNIVLTLRYNFNASRSKYKGTGAGENEKSRM